MAEQSNVGNINAVREWTRRYFYTKQDINYFMTKLNEGLKGYALMIIGPRNKRVTINPGNYQFTLNSDGWYRYLFFFNRNQEITISVQDGITMNYQLDAYNDTIWLNSYICETSLTENYYADGNSHAFASSWATWVYRPATPDKAFMGSESKTHSGDPVNCWFPSPNASPNYIGWIFDKPILITKCKIKYQHGDDAPTPITFKLQGSSDNGTTWYDLMTDIVFTYVNENNNVKELTIPDRGLKYVNRIRLYTNDVMYTGSYWDRGLHFVRLWFYGSPG